MPNLTASKRLATILAQYQYKTIHKKDTLMPRVDAMSMLPSPVRVLDDNGFIDILVRTSRRNISLY